MGQKPEHGAFGQLWLRLSQLAKLLTKVMVSWGILTGEKSASRLTQWLWQASFPCHVVSPEAPSHHGSWLSPRPVIWKDVGELLTWNSLSFYKLISKVASYHFCHSLFIWYESISLAQTMGEGIIQGCEYCEVVITRGHFRTCWKTSRKSGFCWERQMLGQWTVSAKTI